MERAVPTLDVASNLQAECRTHSRESDTWKCNSILLGNPNPTRTSYCMNTPWKGRHDGGGISRFGIPRGHRRCSPLQHFWLRPLHAGIDVPPKHPLRAARPRLLCSAVIRRRLRRLSRVCQDKRWRMSMLGVHVRVCIPSAPRDMTLGPSVEHWQHRAMHHVERSRTKRIAIADVRVSLKKTYLALYAQLQRGCRNRILQCWTLANAAWGEQSGLGPPVIC
jgi:hypothetical protein